MLGEVTQGEAQVSAPGRAKSLFFGLGLTAGIVCSMARADDCVRSTPSPIFAADRNDVRPHSFMLKSDHEAVERFHLGSDTQVKVEHGGCEYFVTTLRFESPDLFAKKYTDAMAYETAASLLLKLKDARPEFIFDLDLASETLLKEARRKRVPKLSQEFSIQRDRSSPLQAMMQIDAAGRHKSFGYLEVSFFIGPL
jgi:hypothetical protein